MNTLSDKLIAQAKALLAKHKKEVIYVIAETGQMYFSKNNAEITAKGREVVGVGDGEVDDEQLTEIKLKEYFDKKVSEAEASAKIDMSKDNVVKLEEEAAAKAKAEEVAAKAKAEEVAAAEEKPEEVENIEPAAAEEVKEAAADVPVKKAEATLPRIKNKK